MDSKRMPRLSITVKMEKYNIFLRWWLFFSIIGVGTLMLFLSGIAPKINQGDITKLSFLIYGVFVIFTVRTGIDTYQLCKETSNDIPEKRVTTYLKRNEVGWFVSDILLTIGMIGTVIGFIYMLSTSLSDVNTGSANNMQGALMQMSIGMSTALYTTAAGLVCSLLLKLQLFNFSNHLDFLINPKGADNVA